jgi:hypothetical protein
LTGLPLLLFFTFTITVFLLALLVALILGLLAAVLFTVVMVLCALVIVLPTVFLTTFAATFLFLWGLGGYYILQWFNEGNMPAEPGTAVGDKLNNWTGGRMGWLMDGSRKKQTEKAMGLGGTPSVHGNGAKSNGSANGTNEREERHQPRKLEKENDQPTPTKQEGGVTKTDTKTASVNVGETT